jgi:branched-chain amino acid transport system permease protein
MSKARTASPRPGGAAILGTVRIETFYLDLTFVIVAILVIGGSGSLARAP